MQYSRKKSKINITSAFYRPFCWGCNSQKYALWRMLNNTYMRINKNLRNLSNLQSKTCCQQNLVKVLGREIAKHVGLAWLEIFESTAAKLNLMGFFSLNVFLMIVESVAQVVGRRTQNHKVISSSSDTGMISKVAMRFWNRVPHEPPMIQRQYGELRGYCDLTKRVSCDYHWDCYNPKKPNM